uniref:peptidylprolyl isomerase n=1 Tax=Fagus sylvatica TaxID=28930 RepID=A0A2N9IWJ6_FAGSY
MRMRFMQCLRNVPYPNKTAQKLLLQGGFVGRLGFRLGRFEGSGVVGSGLGTGEEEREPDGGEREISQEYHPAVCAVISGAEDVGVSSSQFDDFSVAATSTCKARELKHSQSRAFEEQKEIPKDILLEILGPSKVYEGVIKEVINSTIAEYVEKEGLKISKDLSVEQSFEDLEATFEAGQKFSFDVVLQLQEMN